MLGLRGDKPKVPAWVDVNTTEEQQAAIAGNLQNLPALAELGGKTNAANAEILLATLDKLGLGNLVKTITGNLESQARGELPKDVENYLSRKSAEAGVVSGTSGSDFNKYKRLRDLGVTSLEVSNKALDSVSRWMATLAGGMPQFNFASMFVSPQQRIQATFANRENKWQRDWMQNQLKALPSNEEMAYAQMLDYVATWATTAASFGTSSMMGGGGAQQGAGAGSGGGAYSYAERVPMLQQQYLNNNYGY